MFEPPGETHTLVVDEDCEEMVTLFHVTGSLLYVSEDNDDEVIGFDDVFTKVSLFLKTFFLINGSSQPFSSVPLTFLCF